MPHPPRKKLIEVALPLKAINEAAAREKSIRHGHPSTLHLWWARRPLAACRAVLFASLVDDPDSEPVYHKADGGVDEERAAWKRTQLFRLIEELVQWENSNNCAVLHSARAEIARCVADRLVETGKLKRDDVIITERSEAPTSASSRREAATPSPRRGEGGERRSREPGEGRGLKRPTDKPVTVTVGDLIAKGHCRPVEMKDPKTGKPRWRFDTSGLPPFDAVNAFLAEHAPPVLDPFCGGGSIPLEAQRLGLRAFASDLNPVPVLITKALIEIPPKFAGRPPVNPDWQKKSDAEKQATVWEGARGLADDVRYYGKWMRDEAEKRIGHLYPKVKITSDMAKDRPDLKPYVGQELTVIAWLWARTVASPDPAVGGAHTPLVRSFCLSTKKGKETWVRPIIQAKNHTFQFRVFTGQVPGDFKPSEGTVDRRGARCILTGQPISFPYIRAEGQAGKLQNRLMAIVAEGMRGRIYLNPVAAHVETAVEAVARWKPEETISHWPGRTNVVEYGLHTFDKLFTSRQLVALTTFSDLVQEARGKVLMDEEKAALHDDYRPLADGGTGRDAYADAVATYLSLGVSKCADYNGNLVSWINLRDQARSTFSKQALPMVWDFCEVNPLADAAGDPTVSLAGICEALSALPEGRGGTVLQLDAPSPSSKPARRLISTDPPYYDNIGYADLSDFFYVWLRHSLRRQFPQLFATALTPKAQELIATPYRHEGSREKAQKFFESGLGCAFVRMHQMHVSDYPLSVYYAFKQSEEEGDGEDDTRSHTIQSVSTGWETMLEGLIRAGFSITGTWPMRTERGARSISLSANALASSIVLVCRPRPAGASIATRKQFLTELREHLPKALRDLQHGNIAPVDLAQAAIGPGMAVFTRFAKVVEPNGSAMTVRTALGIINQVLDETLAEQEGEFDADTRWALAWFEQFGMKEDAFGIAETLSRAKGTAINGLERAGVVKAKGGKVRLLARSELPADWDPATDGRLTVWETVQHLIRVLEGEGESAAAALLGRLGGMADPARDLAYRLYSICERKKWADEARAYNGLVIAWPELLKLDTVSRSRARGETPSMFESDEADSSP